MGRPRARGNENDTELADTRFTTQAVQIPSSIQPNTAKNVATADLGGDGDIDLTLAIEYTANRVLINNGSGQFIEQTPLSISTRNLDSEHLVTADFKSNGNNGGSIALF